MNTRRSERGQAIIVVTLGFVVLLGFVGLAIDASMVYSDRRHAQNAADAASLAGGGRAALYMEDNQVNYFNWNCAGAGIAAAMAAARQGAVDRAGDNDFLIDQDTADFHGVTTQCETSNYGSFVDKYIDITVWITTVTPATFSQVLYGGPLESRVQSVTRIRPRQPVAFGNAVLALNPGNCSGQSNGITFHGGPDTYIEGGGIFSNGCLRGDGGPTVTSPSISYVAGTAGNVTFEPAAQLVPVRMPVAMATISSPNCGHDDAHEVTAAQFKNSSPLEPGLWCVTGDIRINASDTLQGAKVTIYLVDGGLTINGGATINLTAPDASPNPSPALPGILIYMARGNDNGVEISGNSESTFEGTVYAPESDITMLGNGETEAFKTQLIGWNVEIGGTADTYVEFDKTKVFIKPTSMDLNR